MHTISKAILGAAAFCIVATSHADEGAPQYRAGPPAASSNDRLAREDAARAAERARAATAAPQKSANQELVRTCTYKGAFYAAAASARDMGQSPQETYASIKALRQGAGVGISDQYIKTAINQVFFDPGFIQAGGPPLQFQVMQACVAHKPLGFEPLK